MKAELMHLEGMAFQSNIRGFEMTLDAHGVIGGKEKGPTPKEILLSSIMGCTAMDVVSLMKKYRLDFDRFHLSAEAQPRSEHPKIFENFLMKFEMHGMEVTPEKLKEAVILSLTKYCGVSAMVSLSVALHYEVWLNGTLLHRDVAKFENLKVIS